jgi:hypothetical protein
LSYRRDYDYGQKSVAGETERRPHTTKDEEDDVFAVRPVSSWRRPAHADEGHGGRRRTSHSKKALGSSESSERSAQKILEAQSEEYIREVASTSSWN